jgi:hypothetical protein
VPWLDLLPDDCLDLPVVFTSVLDERFDGGVEVVGQFTALKDDIGMAVYTV